MKISNFKIVIFFVSILLLCYVTYKNLNLNVVDNKTLDEPLETLIPNRVVANSIGKDYNIDSDSVYWDDNIEKPSISIDSNFREFTPSNVFDLNLLEKDISIEKILQDSYYLGDTLVPYLLNEESINASDEQFIQALDKTGLDVFIFRFDDSLNQHRIFLLSPKPYSDMTYYDNYSCCFIQSWNENELRAQPLFEGLWYTFDNSLHILSSSEGFSHNTLLFSGYNTLESFGEGKGVLAPSLLSWTWDMDSWIPSNFREIFETEVVELDSDAKRLINIHKDGIKISNDYCQLEDGSYARLQYYSIRISEDNLIFINEIENGETVLKLTPLSRK